MVRMPDRSAGASYKFGGYVLDVEHRQLVFNTRAMDLGNRTFDLLLLLARSNGRVVSKSEIIRSVWSAVVDESNIQVQIHGLRRALVDAPGAIQTVHRRGYRLTLPVEIIALDDTANAIDPGHVTARLSELPPPGSELIGRRSDLHKVTEALASRRLVSIVGAGGMGKTRLAIEVARRLPGRFPDGVFVVQLAMLTDAASALEAVKSAIGLNRQHDDGNLAIPSSRVLRERKLLVVLDNCEHVIDEAAKAAEWLLQSGSGISVLATSRESLRADGESVYRLSGLRSPSPAATAQNALLYPAARLFFARALAVDPQLVASPQTSASIALICSRLDGMPLALELAAARVAEFGVDGIARRLNCSLELLTGGRRTSLPRQQTLRATLDWSYNLLPSDERRMLRRLSLFAASFTLDDACAVASAERGETPLGQNTLANLVSCSLIVKEATHRGTRYRVLETTREYGFEKLIEADELDPTIATLAEHFVRRLPHIGETLERGETTAIVGNLRGILIRVLSQPQAVDLAIRLTALSARFWLHMSLDREFAERALKAVALLLESRLHGSRTELLLQASLSAALISMEGASDRTETAWRRTLELARLHRDKESETQALSGLSICARLRGAFRESLSLALQLPRDSYEDTCSADFLTGCSLQSLGRLVDARDRLERSALSLDPVTGAPHPPRFGVFTGVAATAMLARVTWLLGYSNRSRTLARAAVSDAQKIGHANTLCTALEISIILAIRMGDNDEAQERLAELQRIVRNYGLLIWDNIAQWLEGWLLVACHESDKGEKMLRSSMDASMRAAGRGRINFLASTLAHALGKSGRPLEGLEIIRSSIAEVERRWR